MLRRFCYVCALQVALCVAAFAAGPDLVYNGDTLEWNYAWKRTECGKVSKKVGIPEVSGIACSRVTPGYIWMQSDDYESYIVATTEKGDSCYLKVKFDHKIRWDWEDMSGGVYDSVNYLFIGAFGDNDETDGNYHIVYFEEPAIEEGVKSITITPSDIEYVYPDGKMHNNEALMYDNRTQTIYIITKVYYNVCQVFSLPFRLDYGDEVQTLTYVCNLGIRSDLGDGSKPYKGFHLVTGADISPDGKYILIKNHNNIVAKYSWILYWERGDEESVEEVLINHVPQPLHCYSYEWQGEAICWLNDDTFYTTSDSDGEPPIFKYVRKWPAGVENVETDKTPNRLILRDNVLYVSTANGLYTLDGRKVE